MVVDANHRHIWNIWDNVSPVLPSDINMLHEDNSSNFTLFVDVSDFELHQTEVAMLSPWRVDDFIDDNEVQYDDTLEDYMDDE